MSDGGNDQVDLSKRRFLTASTGVVGGIGGALAATPFVRSWLPSERAKAAGAPVLTEFSRLEEGGMKVVKWRGKPVWIVRRSADSLKSLANPTWDMKDADSETAEQQPDYTIGGDKTPYRAVVAEYLIVEGVCTHLGCAPSYLPEVTAEMPGGGFFCPCHGSKFDLSGRVYAGAPAGANLKIPPHRYVGEVTDKTVMIGEDPKDA